MESCASWSNKARSSGANSRGSNSLQSQAADEFSCCSDIALPPPAEDEGAAPALYHLPINLGPECSEVVDGRHQRQNNHEPDRHGGGHANGEEITPVNGPLPPAMSQNHGYHRYDLHEHLELAQVTGLDGETLRSCNGAQAADQEFASDDHDRHPCRNQAGVELNQGHECGGDEQLISEGIEQHPDRGDLPTFAGQVTVNSIGDRGDNEQRRGHQFFLPMGAAEAIAGENPDQQWDAENAAERYVIGQIHRGRKIAPGQKAGNETMLNYPPRRMTKAMTAAESCWILQPGR